MLFRKKYMHMMTSIYCNEGNLMKSKLYVFEVLIFFQNAVVKEVFLFINSSCVCTEHIYSKRATMTKKYQPEK
jgi:hypothetical protein